MNKFSIAAGTAALGVATSALTSGIASPAEVRETLLKRCFRTRHFQRAAPVKTGPTASVDAQLIDKESGGPIPYRSPIYDLVASNPHVIAASLFSRKRW
jgi:hypothetical protein